MVDVVLIQCVKSKANEPRQARHLYVSSLFTKMASYADRHPAPWKILSAKHNLVDPTEQIAPYDVYGLTEQQARAIATELQGHDAIEIIAGQDYTTPLVPELERYGVDVHTPCAGMRIGERMQWLDDQIRRMNNEQLKPHYAVPDK